MLEIAPVSRQWLALVEEEILEPERPIIDPHHHLWKQGLGFDYLLDEFRQDTGSGHNVRKTVFVECHAFYDRDAPRHLRSLGETRTIAGLAQQTAASDQGNPQLAAIVGHVDLALAGKSQSLLREVLEQHLAAGRGLLRGIRHIGAHDRNADRFFITPRSPSYLYGKEPFRQGLRILAELGLTFDAWHYHHQNQDFLELAQAVPECTLILDHFGTPLGVGNYRGCRDEIFQQWKEDIRAISRCPNVYAKLGGLAMPDNGYDWHKRERPPDSDEFVSTQKRYYLHTIDCFGPERCMFESNFPMDRYSLSYQVLWNGFKKMVADFCDQDRHALFYGTAERVYRLAD
ncbi:MAG: amidohydrolase family protein [Gammaproteobacteria bacterium]|nr:amidohydrolase family protein [Pseudomonadales bacterium]MCP5345396.1 amidohydrolase family protein [Pseudomonadales bacterium]